MCRKVHLEVQNHPVKAHDAERLSVDAPIQTLSAAKIVLLIHNLNATMTFYQFDRATIAVSR